MPLNEKLFKALELIFEQEPYVVNDGDSAEVDYPIPRMSFLDDAVTPISASRVHGGEQYAVNCPFCGDRKHRLYFSYLWNTEIRLGNTIYRCSDSLVRCFNEECQRKPENKNWIRIKLSTVLNNSNLLDSAAVTAHDESSSGDVLSNQVPLPENLKSITDSTVPEYVRRFWFGVRGFSAETLEHFGVRFAYIDHPLRAGASICQQMITVIPVVQDGQYWFHQLRLIPLGGDPASGYERDHIGVELPKYIIPHGSRKSWALYNIDNAVKHKTVYIVEGVTDVWRIGDSAVARFGKTLSRAQLVLLKSKLFGKRLVIVPDMDDDQALDEAFRQQAALQRSGAFSDVLIAKLPKGKDPGDLRGNPEEVKQCLEQHIILQEDHMKSQFGNQGLLS